MPTSITVRHFKAPQSPIDLSRPPCPTSSYIWLARQTYGRHAHLGLVLLNFPVVKGPASVDGSGTETLAALHVDGVYVAR